MGVDAMSIKAKLVEIGSGPLGSEATLAVTELEDARILGGHLYESVTILLPGDLSPEDRRELAEKEAQCRWCNPKPMLDQERPGLCKEHTRNLLDENERHIQAEKRALEELELLRAENERLEEVGQYLWRLLDNIDTLDDACKGDDVVFRDATRKEQRKRFNAGGTDGYTVVLGSAPELQPVSREIFKE
jgi:hypothetical protein